MADYTILQEKVCDRLVLCLQDRNYSTLLDNSINKQQMMSFCGGRSWSPVCGFSAESATAWSNKTLWLAPPPSLSLHKVSFHLHFVSITAGHSQKDIKLWNQAVKLPFKWALPWTHPHVINTCQSFIIRCRVTTGSQSCALALTLLGTSITQSSS